MPDDKFTKPNMEATPQWAAEFMVSVRADMKSMRDDFCDHFHRIETNVDTAIQLGKNNASDIASLQSRTKQNSDRVRETSEHDMTHAQEVAKVIEKEQELRKNLESEVVAAKTAAQTAVSTSTQALDTIKSVQSETKAQTLILNRFEDRAGELLKNPKVIALLVVLYNVLMKYFEKRGWL